MKEANSNDEMGRHRTKHINKLSIVEVLTTAFDLILLVHS